MDGKTLGAVLGAGNPTGSIFQLIIDERAGATGTGQQPDSPGTLEKSFPLPSALPFEISIVALKSFLQLPNYEYHSFDTTNSQSINTNSAI